MRVSRRDCAKAGFFSILSRAEPSGSAIAGCSRKRSTWRSSSWNCAGLSNSVAVIMAAGPAKGTPYFLASFAASWIFSPACSIFFPVSCTA
jgi:hypothetical protein